MNRRRFLQASGASVALALGPSHLASPAQTAQRPTNAPGWLIYVDNRMDKLGDSLAQRLISAGNKSPLLRALSAGKSALRLDITASPGQLVEQLAYNHVILIAQADDPLLLQAWQREATISPGAIYAFGFGDFRGSLGYIESDRNPFLHAADIPKAPFETQLITITGTDNVGISLTTEALLSQGLVNGVVATKGQWSRRSATILDRDPLPALFPLPAALPATLGSLSRIAVTQASEDEYRGVRSDTGFEPLSIWRAKYYAAGQWDGVGQAASFHNYSVGLHRRSYGNTVWVATFADCTGASKAAQSVAKAAKLSPAGSRWQGNLPPYAWGIAGAGDAPQTGTLALWVEDRSVLMASQTIGG
jgi:hypothetical protein